jgi:hypothetical protein
MACRFTNPALIQCQPFFEGLRCSFGRSLAGLRWLSMKGLLRISVADTCFSMSRELLMLRRAVAPSSLFHIPLCRILVPMRINTYLASVSGHCRVRSDRDVAILSLTYMSRVKSERKRLEVSSTACDGDDKPIG